MILLLKVKYMFLKCFHDNTIKIFSKYYKKYFHNIHFIVLAHFCNEADGCQL